MAFSRAINASAVDQVNLYDLQLYKQAVQKTQHSYSSLWHKMVEAKEKRPSLSPQYQQQLQKKYSPLCSPEHCSLSISVTFVFHHS